MGEYFIFKIKEGILVPGPLVRPNGSLDRHGKVEKSRPDWSFVRKNEEPGQYLT